MNFKITGIFSTVLVALLLMGGQAVAGPTFTFGPEEQGMLKLDYKGQFQLLTRDTGAEADREGNSSEFNFRRNRIALMGAYGDYFGLYVQTEFSEDRNIGPFTVSDGADGSGDDSEFTMLDAVMRFKANETFNVWVGKFKYNFTRENLEACEAPLTLDRSVLIRSPFVSTRDKGVALWGNLFDSKVQYRLDAMNGRNDNLSSPKSNFRYSGRVHVSLLDPESGYGYKGTYMGDKSVLTVGAAYQFESDVAYTDTVAQTGSVDLSAWTADIFFEYPTIDYGTLTASAAYTDYDLDDAFKGANPDVGVIGLTGEKNGSYYKVGYLLPETPLQFFGRYEQWSFANLPDAFGDDVFGQDVDWLGAGLNYYFRGQDLKLTVEYSNADYDQETAAVEDFSSVIAQLQVVF